LGASALMQGLADGYFILPYTIQNYLADDILTPRLSTDLPQFKEAEGEIIQRIDRLMNVKGDESVDSFHRRFGLKLWDTVGMARNKETLKKSINEFGQLREEFWNKIRIRVRRMSLIPS
jgi:succinate dehydrogenase / fumarate reductase flavoprotein subunit